MDGGIERSCRIAEMRIVVKFNRQAIDSFKPLSSGAVQYWNFCSLDIHFKQGNSPKPRVGEKRIYRESLHFLVITAVDVLDLASPRSSIVVSLLPKPNGGVRWPDGGMNGFCPRAIRGKVSRKQPKVVPIRLYCDQCRLRKPREKVRGCAPDVRAAVENQPSRIC